jgi:glycosyltransferase involved in cell wall biosynthesis
MVSSVYVDLIGKKPSELFMAGLETLLHISKVDATITWTADIPTAGIVALSKVLGKKSFVIVGGYEVCNMPEINYGLQTRKTRGAIARWALSNATKVIVPSDAYKQTVKDLVGVNAAVIPNCSEIPKLLDNKKMPKVVMVAGQYGDADTFTALKGISTYNAIAKAMPYTQFFLIGNVEYIIKQRYDSIRYVGGKNHEEVLKMLNMAKVYCQLSYTESFGVALLEAIQSGCVPVITNRGGMVEIVKNNGYMINYGDVDAGIYAVKQALQDTSDRSEIISSERARYSREQRSLNFKKVIDEVLT